MARSPGSTQDPARAHVGAKKGVDPADPARARRDVGDSQLGETTGDETAVDDIHGTSVPWCRETVRSTRR